jgi:CBS domain-containing protein
MKVKEIMTKSPACCVPQTSLQEVAHLMIENDCGAIPVVETLEAKKPLGMITDRDIVISTVAQGKNQLAMSASEIMSFPAIVISSESTLGECCKQMESEKVRRIIVVSEGGDCCGILAQADIVNAAPMFEAVGLVKEVSTARTDSATAA